jgi:guanylate kinase
MSSPTTTKKSMPRPVVFCGPSGVGKGTLIEMLMKRFPEQFGFSVSHATRKPREGEVNGQHYHFTTVDKMKEDISQGKFIEYAEVHGNYYGTSVAAVESVQNSGKICILDIDVQGVQNVKKSTLDPIYIFIAPPSAQALEERLRGRGTESEEDIQKHLANAGREIEYGRGEGNFDRIFVNDDLTKTFEKLARAFRQWYPHLKQDYSPRPVVVCGPSGVGKGTIIKMLMERFPDGQFGFSVSHTTRKPRDGEVDGQDYNFTTVEQMKKEISEGKFIEYAEVHGNYYGTSVQAVKSLQDEGKICILDIDCQGAKNVKKSSLKPYYIFIAPPTMEALELRLRGRGTESEEDIQKRLANASDELAYGQSAGNFDHVFINADLKATFDDVVLCMKEWYPQLLDAAADDDVNPENCTSKCVIS